MEYEIRKSEYENSSLTPKTSPQVSGLIALTRTFQLSERLKVNIYTDLNYALLVLHALVVIYRKSCYLTASGYPIKYHREIGELLLSVYMPPKVAIIHYRGH